jgi:peptide-methionine (R)-S-oxide reductase
MLPGKPMTIINRRDLFKSAGLGVAALTMATIVRAAPQERFAVRKTASEWRRQLGPERYRILREAGTERAGTSPLDREKRRGIFACAGCSLPLFSSAAKFESGTGWPSFFRAAPGAVLTRSDVSMGMRRTEALCRRCGGHLGHLFDDGPKPTGLRYCMNGLALTFRPA